MKILWRYLKPHKWLVVVTLLLAAINTGFSLADPILFGKLVNLAADHFSGIEGYSNNQFFWTFHKITRKGVPYWEFGVFVIIIFSISVAMVSRIDSKIWRRCFYRWLEKSHETPLPGF